MQKLVDLGFDKAAVALLKKDHAGVVTGIKIEISKYSLAKNLLYAIIFTKNEDEIDLWQVRYIGHTRKSFSNRMNGYQAGKGTNVNNRVHKEIKRHLGTGGVVVVYVMADKLLLSMQELHVDVAAGLEYSLIRYYSDYNKEKGFPPLINLAGNPNVAANEEEKQAELVEEDADYHGPDIPSMPSITAKVKPVCSFVITLTPKVFWPLPVFNVKKACDRYFGPHGDVVEVDLVDSKGAVVITLSVPINRTANLNHTPRLYFAGTAGETYTNWKRQYHKVNDTVVILVVGKNHIRLEP
jgi:hypothetical protein